MALSTLEKKRQENIRRNKELLSKLDLDAISSGISRDIEKSNSPQPIRKRKVVKPKAEAKRKEVEPSRRSRRLAGIQSELENPEEAARVREEEEEKERRKREYEALKRTKLFGDFHLIDLITDRKSGDMLFEDKVRSNKHQDEEKKVDKDVLTQENGTLQLLQSLGGKFSAGDFYEQIKQTGVNEDASIASKRKEFDSKRIFQRFDPLDVKLAHYRITAMMFHPATTDRVIAAGDTNGNLGIWAPDASGSEDPTTTIIRPHGKNVSKVLTPANELHKLYSASYDGSVRSLDLNKLSTSEAIYLSDEGSSLGVSDLNLTRNDPSLMFMTTLDGLFCKHDIRTKPKGSIEYLRLHDKKIGGFAINPNNSYQIATASLDRTLRIWDLRKIGQSVYSEFDDWKSPHMYGNYNSRLSVSCIDWNVDNHLVCNGYDDQICIFNYNEDPKITSWKSDYMPDYKAIKRENSEEITLPNNLHPVNKIRHNCQTGRWVSILKSRWQENPQDGMQKFIIANMNRGMDVYDQKGNILAHLNDQIGAVPAVCTLHPTQNWAVGGSASGKIYLIE
ncbi:hypothetical protein KGF57_003473 [Candida theae]|uniref:DNA damage-binding protein CMR1 n=1 Tax=Candida theae TaxID=1198502 RepID=A0AAD5FXX8_9ASCO|nr:uncharacterized protein KGF57_003473 [Candida theae]KAI5955987.1 hypothetical protein KGF57_003473 [Candida theae]